MESFVRILTKNQDEIAVDKIKACLEDFNVSLDFKLIDENTWSQFLVLQEEQSPAFIVERIIVEPESPGAIEIEELSQEILDCKPKSAVEWLTEYMKEVRVIYSFQLLEGIDNNKGWEILSELQDMLWKSLGGVFQADGEGFSNEEGYHILWQFGEGVSGQWNMAVLEPNGKWKNFEMDLSNKKQVKDFFQGKVPSGATRI